MQKKLYLGILGLFLIPGIAWAALAVDSQESSNTAHRGTTSGTALTWSFTNTAGNLLVCGVVGTNGSGNGVTLNAPSYNNVVMTQASSSVGWGTNNDSKAAIYYLVNPATGANTVSSTAVGSVNFAVLAGCTSFSGANTTSPIGLIRTNSSGGTTGTHATAGSMTPVTNNFIFGAGGWGSGTGGTVDAGMTKTFLLNGSGNTAGDDIFGLYVQATSSAINAGFTWTGSDLWGIEAAEINAATSSVATPATSTVVLIQNTAVIIKTSAVLIHS